MRLHLLGICGTFMSGLAVLAKQSGHEVTGQDENVYPPISTELKKHGIELIEGYSSASIPKNVDCVVVGNVIKRGNPAMEYVMANNIAYTSGPAWLAENILAGRCVLGVAGTHGKTTTSAMLAWMLEYVGFAAGFLIGGVPENFSVSARLGSSPFFVIEADEYDSAFFDKRSKCIHYRPNILILNNLEYDHADIFPNLAAISQQFHHLVKTVPSNGKIIYPHADEAIENVLAMGCWTPLETFGGSDGAWGAVLEKPDGSVFNVTHQGEVLGTVRWKLLGMHNVHNALSALAAAHSVGVPIDQAIHALDIFLSVKRRLEVKGIAKDIVVYDDFAHHPTAIATTLSGLRANIGDQRLIAIVEFGSYTMRAGVHKDKICGALADADMVICKDTANDWGLKDLMQDFNQPSVVLKEADDIVSYLVPRLQPGDHVLVMSNAGFGNIHQKLLQAITEQ